MDKLDARALRELAGLVESVGVEDLGRWTPCAGWRVRDLLAHMNSEHEAISAPLSGSEVSLDGDPRRSFGRVVDRWIEAFRGRPADEQVAVPKFGATSPAGRILGVHFADMLVHRWDLTRALGLDHGLPEDLGSISTSSPSRNPTRSTGPTRSTATLNFTGAATESAPGRVLE
ncbi:maleylpyruvate isomerase family mycothiol-dependent enzyme [Nocardia takedensis]|uniref:maleylpyruvate isomerase family mycothiol-dependent enzyme n=1 Tax=Nocardia takedensis TaxID=259390 RepID=UPI0006847362|nr:maleylpyruvate isomerase family mycothiol-dependent enzyme [Nocardia takedensis]